MLGGLPSLQGRQQSQETHDGLGVRAHTLYHNDMVSQNNGITV